MNNEACNHEFHEFHEPNVSDWARFVQLVVSPKAREERP